VREGNAREVVLGMIARARKELLLEHQAMADPEVLEALEAALRRGVRVRLIGSPQEAGDTYFLSGAMALEKAGAGVRFLPAPYVHAKVLVRDGEEALLGSLNLSANSLNANRELAVRFTAKEAPEAFARLLKTLEGDWQKGLPENPFALPPVEAVVPWQDAPRYFGRIATVEGRVARVEDRGTVAFLHFGQGESDLRLVVFSRAYGLFAQPFPESYLGKRVRARGRIVLYAGYYEIVLEGPDQLEVLKEEACSLALAGVEGAWAARCELEENFFTFVSSEDLPHLVLAFEGLDLPDPPLAPRGRRPEPGSGSAPPLDTFLGVW